MLVGYRCSPSFVPGRPDVAFTHWRVAVFVDGCFWHGCPDCYVRPATNRDFWDEKLRINVDRDNSVNQALTLRGWTVLRFWEHQVRTNVDSVADEIAVALAAAGRSERHC